MTDSKEKTATGLHRGQWVYTVTSSCIIFVLMLIVGYLNIRNLEKYYQESFFDSAQAVSRGAIQTLEYGLKYGKSVTTLYAAGPLLRDLQSYLAYSDNASLITPEGQVLFTVEPRKSLRQEDYTLLLQQRARQQLAGSAGQAILYREEYHQFLPVRGADGVAQAYVEIAFSDDMLKSRALGFSTSSAIAVLLITLMGTLLFAFIISRLRTTNDKGELRRGLLMGVMIFNVTLCQLAFNASNIWSYRQTLERNASDNMQDIGHILKKSMDTVTAKGLAFEELGQLQTWMADVLALAPDIAGAYVRVDGGKSIITTSGNFSMGSALPPDARVDLALAPDPSQRPAVLTLVLNRENLSHKVMDAVRTAALIMLGSIVVLVQVTFVMILLLNRRAIAQLKHYNEELEAIIEQRTRQIKLEQAKSERLLLNILPAKVADDLKAHGFSEPEAFDDVSVLFSDVVGFTTLSSGLEAKFLIKELSDIFTHFDRITDSYQCQRIKTIGDAYLCVSGMPQANPRHAQNLVQAALDILDYLEERNRNTKIQWCIRVGIHSGSVVGGIVGTQKYLYDVFGDTINTASRMESNSDPMCINISETTKLLVQDDFAVTSRGAFEVKGKGVMPMYFVDRRR